jgi:hypothetical protein
VEDLSLVKKLFIKPGMKIGIINAPEGYREQLDELPPGAEVVESPAPASLDQLHLFVRSIAELNEQLPAALPLIKYDAHLWIAYPKKSSKIKTDISRDVGWDAVRQAGLEGVSLISLDETWSMMRFRPAERVGR